MNRVDLPCPEGWAKSQGAADAPSPLAALRNSSETTETSGGRASRPPDGPEARPPVQNVSLVLEPSLSDAQLALCRNLTYALHGYPFRRADLHAAFYRELPVLGNEQGELEDGMNRRFRIAAPNLPEAVVEDSQLRRGRRSHGYRPAAELGRR